MTQLDEGGDHVTYTIHQTERFIDWYTDISSKNEKAKGAIAAALDKLEGWRGDIQKLKDVDDVWESRVYLSPGYRIYYTREARTITVLCGGTKKSQKRDIRTAGKLVKEIQDESD